MFLRVCALSLRDSRCRGMLAAQPPWCVPRRGIYCTFHPEVRGTVFLVCVRVWPNHSNSSIGLQHQLQQQQCSSASVVPSPGTAAGKPCCSYGFSGQEVSHSSSNPVDTTLSGNVMTVWLIKLIQTVITFPDIDGMSSTCSGF